MSGDYPPTPEFPMSTIVKRLRDHDARSYEEAAAELERQAAEIKRLRSGVLWHCEACGTVTHDDGCDCTRMETGTQRLVRFDPKPMSDEIKRLREALKEIGENLPSGAPGWMGECFEVIREIVAETTGNEQTTRETCRHMGPADVRHENGKPKWYCGNCGTFLHS